MLDILRPAEIYSKESLRIKTAVPIVPSALCPVAHDFPSLLTPLPLPPAYTYPLWRLNN